MSFFTVGNLLTIGILTAVLILFRYVDRHNRSVDLAREFGKRLKDELTQYVAEREAAVKDYALDLDVQQKSARELLKRLQMTEEEFSGRAQIMAKIDERLSTYDASLEELVRMTGRVDENLKRIGEESVFVENVLKRVSAVKDKLDVLERDLSDVELRFERENTASLEQAVESLVASVSSAVSDLTVQAETIERKVEDHREAVDEIEKAREKNLARDVELINRTLSGAMEQAASRADKIEDAALVKLREQALERVQRYQAAVEEKLKTYQENTKNKVAETQGLVKTYKDEWKNDSAEIEAKQKIYRDEWKKDVLELNELARGQKETWKNELLELKELAKTQREVRKQEAAAEDAAARQMLASLETAAVETKEVVIAESTALEDFLTDLRNHVGNEIARIETNLSGDTGALEKWMNELRERTAGISARIEEEMHRVLGEAEEKATALAETSLEKWRDAAESAEDKVQDALAVLEAAATDQAEKTAAGTRNLENRLEEARQQFDELIARSEQGFSAESGTLEKRMGVLKKQFDDVILRGQRHVEEEKNAQNRRIEELQKQFALVFARNEQELSAETGTREKQLEELKKQFDDVILRGQQQIKDEKTLQDDRIKGLQQQFALALARSEQDISAETETLEKRMGELKKQLDGLVSRGEQQIIAETGTLEKRMEELKKQFDDVIVRGQQQIKDEKNFQNDRIEELQKQFALVLARNEQELSAETGTREKRMGELKKQFDDIIVRGQQQIENERGIQDSRIGELREYAVESAARLEGEIERAMEEAGEKAAVLAEANLEKWRRTTEAADAGARESLTALETAWEEREKIISAQTAAAEKGLMELRSHIDDSVSELESRVSLAAEKVQGKALEAADQKLEEYRAAQLLQYRQLEVLAEDTVRLDAELRTYLRETEDRIRQDFVLYEQEAAQQRSAISAEFAAAVQLLKDELETAEKGLTVLKSQAYENVSEKLNVFEDDFFRDLSGRGEDIDRRFELWQGEMEVKLEGLADESAAERRNLELAFTEQLKNRLQEQHERFVTDLEHLKAETGAFEEGIREHIDLADQSLAAFKDQLDRDLKDARGAAEVSARAEIGRYGLSMAEALKQHQRELEGSLKDLSDGVDERNGEITALLEASRRETEEWQYKFSAQLRDADNTIDDARRRARELAAESDERLAAIRSSIEDIREEAKLHRTELLTHSDEQARNLDMAIKEADRHLKEFINQTKLFEKADELKTELEHHIEDLQADMARLDQRRSEAAELEAQFVKIKRLEDDINSRMTNFLSEKRRIELMEADFGRILQTSRAVEEKLAQISASDDTLQAVQIRIRQLSDAMTDAEEKYQRIEKKNKTLDATNDDIDRNFKVLQETETLVRRLNEDLDRCSGEVESLKVSVETLNRDNEKAREASEKLSTLDLSVEEVEKRIEAMQVAREWLARTETRLNELNRQTQDQLKLMGSLLKEERGKTPKEKGAPPPAIRENVFRLHRQGWSIDEIARSLKLSKGEVELILEMGMVD
jgi:chromosome segregation ATPase